MKTGTVGYHFELADREVSFEVGTQARDIQNDGDHPEWALLKNKQCACCPLKEADCAYCPVAVRMNEVMTSFADNQSTERVKVTVTTEERNYFEECDLQVGLNSLMGLLMATSGCPVLKDLQAMASFHIPFCSTRETLHRTVGSYLIKQYFKQLQGEEPDWKLIHLKELYDVLEGLNRDFSKRVQSSVSSDAISNAVIMFFATSVVVASSLEQQLQRHQSYLMNSEADV
ncbi:MAG: DUF6901 family protein [Opitutaceae bacterium]